MLPTLSLVIQCLRCAVQGAAGARGQCVQHGALNLTPMHALLCAFVQLRRFESQKRHEDSEEAIKVGGGG